jgi:hypothetical protein
MNRPMPRKRSIFLILLLLAAIALVARADRAAHPTDFQPGNNLAPGGTSFGRLD